MNRSFFWGGGATLLGANVLVSYLEVYVRSADRLSATVSLPKPLK